MWPKMYKETADTVTKPVSIIFEKSWLLDKVPSDWKETSLSFLRKVNTENYMPVSLTSVSGKEQILLEEMLRHTQDGEVTKTTNTVSPRADQWPSMMEQ